MNKLSIGVLGASEIAFRRFLPALENSTDFEFAGVASRTPEKTTPFTERFGGRAYMSYEALLEDKSINAVYLPLPPALHAEWGERALQAGKHVLMEKPFTTDLVKTERLVRIAGEKGLALHENYMFLYHSQLAWIEDKLRSGALGQLRLIRSAFGFPRRAAIDFRYNKELGGGALLDCGGYPIRIASRLLGDTARIIMSRLSYINGFNVDVYGSATLENDAGQVAQIAFGMDNSYKCELEIWGSTGCLKADRIFTAPAGQEPMVSIITADGLIEHKLQAADSFARSVEHFAGCISSPEMRNVRFSEIKKQSELIEQFKESAR